MNPHRSPSAFTLLELILVMIILSIAAALIVPSVRTFAIGRQTDNAVTSILTLANYARTHAISESRIFRMNFDTTANTVFLTAQNAAVWEAPTGNFGEHVSMPDGAKLDVNVVPMPNTLLVLPTGVVTNAITQVPPYGQALAQQTTVMQAPHADAGSYMEFQPSGRVDPLLVKLTDKLGKEVDLGCQSTTETLHVLTAKEMQ